MNTKLCRVALPLALAAALAACDRTADRTAATPRDGSTVGQKLDNAMARSKEDLDRAGEKIKPALREAGDELARAGQSMKPTIDKAGEKIAAATSGDAMITTSIKADYLKDPDLSVLKIEVDTRDGVVSLNGLAKDATARDRAEKIAAAVKGVKEVHNHLAVKQG